ncbi:MAG: YceI family protein [Hyphomonadaceae bacterium]|jgi:polyisoprenoid-binding protein YceI|nr:YceI family protein [Caulobacteraceae bacterium]MBP6689047.1 YceI family protein [Hyphomonadaceae bacterium]
MRLMFAAAAALTLAACNPPAETPATTETPALEVNAPTGEYTLDPNHSTVTVRAQHFGLAHYTLRFNKVAGTLNFNAETPTQSTIQATVDVTSLDTPYTGDRDFDSELQNSSWLDAATSPTATFTSTSVESTGANTARVTGDLTLRGQTHPITLDVTYDGSHSPHPLGMQVSSIGFSARGTFQRSQFGINELIPRAGNDGVSDQVELVIEAEFMRPIENAPVPGNTTAEPVN